MRTPYCFDPQAASQRFGSHPSAFQPRLVAAARKPPAAVPMSRSRPWTIDELLDLGERSGERALPRLHLRHVDRILALGIAREDQIASQPRVDVLEPAAPAFDQPIDEQLIARGAELLNEVDVFLVLVLRLEDDIVVVAAAHRAGDVLEDLFARSRPRRFRSLMHLILFACHKAFHRRARRERRGTNSRNLKSSAFSAISAVKGSWRRAGDTAN